MTWKTILTFILLGLSSARIVSAGEISFNGIALGNEAKQLMKKFKIDPSDADVISSDESCDRIAAKKLISCVWRVAQCRETGSAHCPPDDLCASAQEKNIRDQENRECKEGEAAAAELRKWGANLQFAIQPKQVVCATENIYRKVINAYLDGNEGPLRRELSFSCRITENTELAKILGESKDGKLFHVEYQIPYSNTLSDGWLAKGSLISKEEYLRSRY